MLADVVFVGDRRYLNAVQTTSQHLLRYLAAAVVVNKRRRNVMKDLVKVLQQVPLLRTNFQYTSIHQRSVSRRGRPWRGDADYNALILSTTASHAQLAAMYVNNVMNLFCDFACNRSSTSTRMR